MCAVHRANAPCRRREEPALALVGRVGHDGQAAGRGRGLEEEGRSGRGGRQQGCVGAPAHREAQLGRQHRQGDVVHGDVGHFDTYLYFQFESPNETVVRSEVSSFLSACKPASEIRILKARDRATFFQR